MGGSSFGQSGPSETANASEWGICVSLLPLFIITEDTGAAEREGIPLNAVFFALVFPCTGGGAAQLLRLALVHRLYNIREKCLCEEETVFSVCASTRIQPPTAPAVHAAAANHAENE